MYFLCNFNEDKKLKPVLTTNDFFSNLPDTRKFVWKEQLYSAGKCHINKLSKLILKTKNSSSNNSRAIGYISVDLASDNTNGLKVSPDFDSPKTLQFEESTPKKVSDINNEINNTKASWHVQATLRPTPKLAKTRLDMNKTTKQHLLNYSLGNLERPISQLHAESNSRKALRKDISCVSSNNLNVVHSVPPERIVRNAQNQMKWIRKHGNEKLALPRFRSARNLKQTREMMTEDYQDKHTTKPTSCLDKSKSNTEKNTSVSSDGNIAETSLQMRSNSESRLSQVGRNPKGRLYKAGISSRSSIKYNRLASMDAIANGTQKVSFNL